VEIAIALIRLRYMISIVSDSAKRAEELRAPGAARMRVDRRIELLRINSAG